MYNGGLCFCFADSAEAFSNPFRELYPEDIELQSRATVKANATCGKYSSLYVLIKLPLTKKECLFE